jgi:hypothetical protein
MTSPGPGPINPKPDLARLEALEALSAATADYSRFATVSEPVHLSHAERSVRLADLRELTAVTDEYARLSQTAFGLAAVAAGAWVALGRLLLGHAPESARTLLALAPLFYLGGLALVRRSYQRHGVVRPAEASRRSRRVRVVLLAALTFAAAAMVRQVEAHGDAYALFGLAPWAIAWLLVLGLVAVPLLAAVVTQGTGDCLCALWAMTLASVGFPAAEVPGFSGQVAHINHLVDGATKWVSLVVFIALGVADHLRYRHVERCLFALRTKGERTE